MKSLFSLYFLMVILDNEDSIYEILDLYYYSVIDFTACRRAEVMKCPQLQLASLVFKNF